MTATTIQTPIRALTICQPFASLIADGSKWVENRTWCTSHRGPLAIHAGSSTRYLEPKELADYPTGGIVAVADLVACVRLSNVVGHVAHDCQELARLSIDRMHFLNHEHTEGPWCWILQNVQPCDFVKVQGAQGIWNFRNDGECSPD